MVKSNAAALPGTREGPSAENPTRRLRRGELARAAWARAWAAMIVATLASHSACGGSKSESGGIGVAECDEYEARRATCGAQPPRLGVMPDAERVQRDVWKQMAKTDRQTVEANCRLALRTLGEPQVCP